MLPFFGSRTLLCSIFGILEIFRLYIYSFKGFTVNLLVLQAASQVLDENTAQLWWAGKDLLKTKTLETYTGKNEKTKIVVKLQKVCYRLITLSPLFPCAD